MPLSATINTTIPSTNAAASLLVIYPGSTATFTDTMLKNELLVIEAWFQRFSDNHADIKGTAPRNLHGYPVSVLVVLRDFHKSVYSPNEKEHITANLSTAEQWNVCQHRTCVHIYCRNNKVTEGYDSWKSIYRGRGNEKYEGDFAWKIVDAQNNHRGILRYNANLC